MRLTIPLLIALLSVACDSTEPTDASPDVADVPIVDAPLDVMADAVADSPLDMGLEPPIMVDNGTDFFRSGTADVEVSTGTLSEVGCELEYALYTPAGLENAPLVVLGHGFTKQSDTVAGFAMYFASHGVRVATPSYCFSSFVNVDHEANGRSAAALSAELAMGASVIHAGHSAGGLSAVIAATLDDATVGVLGLDLVDSEELGLMRAGEIDLPLLGLVGEPSACNSDNNADVLFATASNGSAIGIVGAKHCDFEEPTDSVCRTLCGVPSAARVALVKALGMAFVASTFATDSTAARWFEADGEVYQQLIDEGLVTAK